MAASFSLVKLRLGGGVDLRGNDTLSSPRVTMAPERTGNLSIEGNLWGWFDSVRYLDRLQKYGTQRSCIMNSIPCMDTKLINCKTSN